MRLCTFRGSQRLTATTGFFFARGPRLFLVTNRHVLPGEPSAHFSDRSPHADAPS